MATPFESVVLVPTLWPPTVKVTTSPARAALVSVLVKVALNATKPAYGIVTAPGTTLFSTRLVGVKHEAGSTLMVAGLPTSANTFPPPLPDCWRTTMGQAILSVQLTTGGFDGEVARMRNVAP